MGIVACIRREIDSVFLDRFWAGCMWGVFWISATLLAWQGIAWLTGNVPGHIMPVVHLLSGTQEAVPVAFSWALFLGFYSAAGFAASALFLLIKCFFYRK